MPALIDYRVCDDSPHCSSARVCPGQAFEMKDGKWTIHAEECGGCSGVCTRVCPSQAVKFAPTQEGLDRIAAELAASTETADELFEKRYGVKPSDPRATGRNLDHVGCADFQAKVVQSDVPVVVDFWAEWCSPCKVLAPTFKKLAEEYEGRLKFMKLDTEECSDVPARYRIRGIPTMLFFHGGQVVAQEVGAVPEAQIRATIERVLQAN